MESYCHLLLSTVQCFEIYFTLKFLVVIGIICSFQPVPYLSRGMKRRCLVFEMGGGRRKHFNENSSSLPPILSQEGNTSSTNKQLVPIRSGHDSSRHILPGIGLHLNALATAPKEYKVVKQDSVSGRLVIAPPSSMVNFHSLSTAQEQVNQPLAINSMERDTDPIESAVPLLEDASQASANMTAEELNQSSPKKRRHVTLLFRVIELLLLFFVPLFTLDS